MCVCEPQTGKETVFRPYDKEGRKENLKMALASFFSCPYDVEGVNQ